MTTDDKNGIPDDEFEAFLKGEDELSRRLKAMPQPSPSAEHDAAILKRVKFALAQEGRPAAANDAAPAGFNRRWRVPVGIAAALVAGVLAHQTWQVGSEADKLAEVPYAPPPASETKMDAAPAAKAAPEARQPRMEVAPPKVPSQAPAPAPSPAPMATAAALAKPPPPPPAAAATSPELPVPSPAAPMQYAPAVEAHRRAAPYSAAESPRAAEVQPADGSTSVNVTGSRKRAESHQFALPEKSTPQAWIELIDEMLKAGLPRDALDEWSKFRQAYPDYPVPEPLAGRIKALQK